MVRKYAHLSSAHLTEYVDRLSRLKVVENEPRELDRHEQIRTADPLDVERKS